MVREYVIEERYGMIGSSQPMRELYKTIEKVAPTDASVFIMGESGTGKELVARAIYENSLRKDMPYVVVNCPAIPKELMESELFGYEKGAFTGAVSQKAGKLELADKGTVFFDEICDTNIEHQAKLLRVMETGEYERVGGTKVMTTDFRSIAATSKNIEKYLEDEKIRFDFYQRVNEIPIYIPPLRERGNDDLVMLANHFLHQHGNKSLSKDALDLLVSHSWPGNVRELKKTISRLAILTEDDVISINDVERYTDITFSDDIYTLPRDAKIIYNDEEYNILDIPIPLSIIEKYAECGNHGLLMAIKRNKMKPPHRRTISYIEFDGKYLLSINDALDYYERTGNRKARKNIKKNIQSLKDRIKIGKAVDRIKK